MIITDWIHAFAGFILLSLALGVDCQATPALSAATGFGHGLCRRQSAPIRHHQILPARPDPEETWRA